MHRRTKTTAYGVAVLGLLAAVTGCGSGPSGSPAAVPVSSGSASGSVAPSASASGAADSAVWATWGVKPLPPTPAAPADKPIKLTASGPAPVFSNVTTDQKIVFVTLDDGAEKDPKFIEMMTDLKIPVTMFLTKNIISNDYGYFKPLQAMGNSIQNHTVTHPAMSTKTLAQQKAEVCDDQAVLTQQYGKAPFLFRPPYGDGAHTPNLNTAVQECGPRGIVLWRETMQIHDMQYQGADKKLRPGDIILAHFRGPTELKGETMTKMFAELLNRIQEQGFAVARLDDYIQPPS